MKQSYHLLHIGGAVPVELPHLRRPTTANRSSNNTLLILAAHITIMLTSLVG